MLSAATVVGLSTWPPVVAVAQSTYSLAPRFLTSAGTPLAGVTITIYLHGSPHIPINVIATGVTDSNGYLVPAFTATIGQEYDFTTTSPLVPAGSFTASAPTNLTLIPGPPGPSGSPGPPGPTGSPGSSGNGSTQTNVSFTIPSLGSTVTVAVVNGTAFANGSYAYITDNSAHGLIGLVTSGGTTNSLVVKNVDLLQGSVGNTMPSSSLVTFSGVAICPSPGSNVTISGTCTINATTPTPLPSPSCANSNCNFSGVLLTVTTPTPLPSPTCANANCSFSGVTLTVNSPTPAPTPTCANANCSFSAYTLTVATQPTATPAPTPSPQATGCGTWTGSYPYTLDTTGCAATSGSGNAIVYAQSGAILCATITKLVSGSVLISSGTTSTTVTLTAPATFTSSATYSVLTQPYQTSLPGSAVSYFVNNNSGTQFTIINGSIGSNINLAWLAIGC